MKESQAGLITYTLESSLDSVNRVEQMAEEMAKKAGIDEDDLYRAAVEGRPGTGWVTGEQQTRTTGIACLSGGGAGADAGAAFLSSSSRERDGSSTTARITPSPSSAAATAKANV